MGKIEVYHGTGHRATPYFDEGEHLYGMFFVGDPASSGILTNDLKFATAFAVGAEVAGRGSALILKYSIPDCVLKLTEPPNNNIAYYYTEDWVEPTELPRIYLRALGITIADAIERHAANEIAFYRVHSQYLTGMSFPNI
jgi:hypothetical protein